MTTYTISGIGVDFSDDQNSGQEVDAFEPNVSLEIFTPDGVDGFTYSVLDNDDIPEVAIDFEQISLRVNGSGFSDPNTKFFIGVVDWIENGEPRSSIVLSLSQPGFTEPDFIEYDYTFVLSGDEFPNLTNLTEANDFFENSIVGLSAVTSGDFAPD